MQDLSVGRQESDAWHHSREGQMRRRQMLGSSNRRWLVPRQRVGDEREHDRRGDEYRLVDGRRGKDERDDVDDRKEARAEQ